MSLCLSVCLSVSGKTLCYLGGEVGASSKWDQFSVSNVFIVVYQISRGQPLFAQYVAYQTLGKLGRSGDCNPSPGIYREPCPLSVCICHVRLRVPVAVTTERVGT